MMQAIQQMQQQRGRGGNQGGRGGAQGGRQFSVPGGGFGGGR